MIWSKQELNLKINELKTRRKPLSTKEVSELLGISTKTAIKYLNSNNMINLTKKKNKYYWDCKDILNYITKDENYHYLLKDSPEYVSSKELKEQFGSILTNSQIRHILEKNKDGRISMLFLVNKIKYHRHKIEEEISYVKPINNERTYTTLNGATLSLKNVMNNEDYILYTKIIEEIGCPKWYVKHLIKYNKLPNSTDFSTAETSNSHTYVHIKDYPTLLNFHKKKIVFGDRNSFSDFNEEKEPIDRFDNMLKNYSFKDTFPTTHNLYYDFVTDYIANTKTLYVYNYVTSLSRTYMHIKPLLTKEIHLYSNKELKILFLNGSLRRKYKEVLRKFLKFIKIQQKTNYSTVPIVRTRFKEKNKTEIYSRSEFYNMYQQVNNINRHLEKAINSETYCQDWFILIMMFSNAWRLPDIVKIPSPNLNIINIENLNFNWFKTNILSSEDSIKLINYLQKHNHFIINKTNALNELFVPTDMTIVFATAISLLELFRKERKYNTHTLLPNYIKPSKDANYFNYMFKGNVPSFSFKKITKSLLTYSYITARNIDKHAGAANAISTRLRGHKNIDTIQQYVLPTGNDFDDIFRHLYRRGHFGYLYSLIVDLSIKQGTKELSLEEKTESIEELIKIFSPEDIENASAFYLEQRKKLLSVSQQVIQLSKEELDQKLIGIHNGNMPSYQLEGQCFISGECNQPGRNCNSCKYLIPKVSFLLSASNEINDLIDALRNTNNQNYNKRIKLTYLILNLLGVLNQSVKSFGKDYANEYLNFDDLKMKLSSVQTKMLEG